MVGLQRRVQTARERLRVEDAGGVGGGGLATGQSVAPLERGVERGEEDDVVLLLLLESSFLLAVWISLSCLNRNIIFSTTDFTTSLSFSFLFYASRHVSGSTVSSTS